MKSKKSQNEGIKSTKSRTQKGGYSKSLCVQEGGREEGSGERNIDKVP